MRDIYQALADYEAEFAKRYGITLNEAMALCSISGSEETLTSTEIAGKTGMTTSHTSKVIRSIEEKELIKRSLGNKDKRQMYFCLSDRGKKCLSEISCSGVVIPEILRPVFDKLCKEEE